MKTLNPRHAELPESSERPDLFVGSQRRRGQRRRYLYEIEFFDAGHTGSLRASVRNDRVSEGYAELLGDGSSC